MEVRRKQDDEEQKHRVKEREASKDIETGRCVINTDACLVVISLAFFMLDLGFYQRSGLQVLKATCEDHRKRVHPSCPRGLGRLGVKLHDARIKSESKECKKDDNTA